MIKSLVVTIIVFITVINNCAVAQQALLTGGGDAIGSSGTVNYSIGQIDYSNFNSTSGVINQGVQQPLSNSTLPVNFLNFCVFKQKETTLVEWSTESESNASYFIVESSNNQLEFKQLSKINASGNSNSLKKYNFIDASPYKGVNYYRLKQVDKDGRFAYSKVRSLHFDRSEIAIIYPNPTSNIIFISLKENENSAHYELYDQQGRSFNRSNIFRSSTTLNLSSFPAATYLLKVSSTNMFNQVFTIIKK